jgi:hypothetical protein
MGEATMIYYAFGFMIIVTISCIITLIRLGQKFSDLSRDHTRLVRQLLAYQNKQREQQLARQDTINGYPVSPAMSAAMERIVYRGATNPHTRRQQ